MQSGAPPYLERCHPMRLSDYETTLWLNAAPVRIRISSAALHMLWVEDAGPQTPMGLYVAHRAMFEEIVSRKRAVGSAIDGIVVVEENDMKV